MNKITVNLTKVQETSLLTLYTRALDKRTKNPISNDPKAEEIVQGLDYDFEKLKVPAKEGIGGGLRAKLLDVCVEEFITKYHDAIVIDMGCGFDSREIRVNPPSSVSWFDVDFPNVIELRRMFYHEHDGYSMISSSLTDAHWLDNISFNRPVILVADGLFPFLTESEIKQLIEKLINHFPSGEIAFNGYTRFASRALKYHPSIKAIGIKEASSPGFDDPREPEKVWNQRLQLIEAKSIVGSSYIAKTPLSYRVLSKMMYHFPGLKREGGWILRYRF